MPFALMPFDRVPPPLPTPRFEAVTTLTSRPNGRCGCRSVSAWSTPDEHGQGAVGYADAADSELGEIRPAWVGPQRPAEPQRSR